MLSRARSPQRGTPPVCRSLAAGPRRGVTIFELLIVLTLLSVAAMVGIPAYFGRASVTLDNATRLLAKDLREVQNRAALYGEPLELRFDAAGDGYRATDAFGQPLISPYGSGDFVRRYSFDAVFRGVSLAVVGEDEDDVVRFDADGRPLEGLEIELRYGDEVRQLVMRKRSGLLAIDGLGESWTDLGL